MRRTRQSPPHPFRDRSKASAAIAAALAAVAATGSAAVAQAAETLPATTPVVTAATTTEHLNRGLVSIRTGNGNFLSWRLLNTDPAGIGFNVYRGSQKVNAAPIITATNFVDVGGPADARYTVRPIINGVEVLTATEVPVTPLASGSDVRIQKPGGGTTPSGESYTYAANDASVGDLDGDGEYEIVLKWNPSNAKDNSQSGYTGNVFIDAYKIDGTRLWRIDLGRNIRAGAHYTQFQVYDYDGDGKAEVAMKTADGTKDGAGTVIGSSSADYRNSAGYVLSGPEFLTMFNGRTGAAMSTVNYDPPRGTVSAWGDSYGNRVDRFLAGTAYLDGSHPSVIMSRGYYTRTVVAAWDFGGGRLTRRWTFDSNSAGSQYTGQGNHQLSIADVDADGKDEIIFGSMAINDNGSPLWTTGLNHGDALHVLKDPSRNNLLVFKPHEDSSKPATSLVDGRTGSVVVRQGSCGCDNGRGVAADIYAGNPGIEFWSAAVNGLYTIKGSNVGRKPSSINFVIWWDGDAQRELLDGTHIDKYGTGGDTRLLSASGVQSINGTKSNPSLSADLFGDWREEVIWPTSDNTALRIYSTTIPTDISHVTLMQDRQYREAIAWQNTAYNQPPHPSFFIGATPPRPANIYHP